TTRTPRAPTTSCVYVGPSRTPTAAAAAAAAATAASISSDGSSLGQTCASATPKAGGAATTRSVTLSAWSSPPSENALTVISRPGSASSTSTSRERAAASAPATAAASSLSSVTYMGPVWPCRSGALTTHG